MQSANASIQSGFSLRLFTRYEHGNLPVEVTLRDGRSEYRVEGHGTFKTVKGMLSALYGREVPGMTFDRYFGLGKYNKTIQGGGDVLDLFGVGDTRVDGDPTQQLRETAVVYDSEGTEEEQIQRFWDSFAGKANTLNVTEMLGVVERERAGFQERLNEALDNVLEGYIEQEETKGIDLAARSGRRGARYKADEVRKLLCAGFMGKMKAKGYDPEDVLQEVYRGILVRNNGKCPFEEGKGSFGHYVHMVCSCILTNYHRKQSRRLDNDSVPLADEQDVGQWGSVGMGYGTEIQEGLLEGELRDFLEGWDEPQAKGALRVLPYVVAGCRRGEIVKATGMNEQAVSRAVACLRRATGAWASSMGMDWGVPEKFQVGMVG